MNIKDLKKKNKIRIAKHKQELLNNENRTQKDQDMLDMLNCDDMLKAKPCKVVNCSQYELHMYTPQTKH